MNPPNGMLLVPAPAFPAAESACSSCCLLLFSPGRWAHHPGLLDRDCCSGDVTPASPVTDFRPSLRLLLPAITIVRSLVSS